jgi:hypothetical protein
VDEGAFVRIERVEWENISRVVMIVMTANERDEKEGNPRQHDSSATNDNEITLTSSWRWKRRSARGKIGLGNSEIMVLTRCGLVYLASPVNSDETGIGVGELIGPGLTSLFGQLAIRRSPVGARPWQSWG